MASERHLYEGLQLAPSSQAGLETDGRGLEFVGNPRGSEKWHTTQRLNRRHSKKVFGVSRTTLLLALLIIFLVVAIAVVAGVLGTRKASTAASEPPSQQLTSSLSSTASPSSTSSSTSAATASASPYSCTNNGTVYKTSDNTLFLVYCNTNFLVGANYHTSASVLTVLNLNSFGACLEACAVSNSLKVTYPTAGTCLSATWFGSGAGLDACYLKNATANTDGSNGVYQPGDPSSSTGSLIS